jgi:membrane dipeptidase
MPWSSGPREGGTEALTGAVKADIDFVSLTMGAEFSTTHDTLRLIAAERARIAASDALAFVETVDDITRAKEAGRLAIGFHFQGAGPLANDVDLIPVFYALGVRHMILSYNQRNRFCDGCNEPNDGGLSRLGMRAVDELNRVGMILDCSHLSYLSSMQIIERSSAPVIFSHSNAAAVLPSYRNIKDDQIIACANKDGLIGICGVGKFLTESLDSTVEGLADHIDHIADLVGDRHIALGLDSVYYPEVLYKLYADSKDVYPVDLPPPPWNYFDLADLRYLPDVLLSRGYSDDAISGILGGNFLRLARQVWKPVNEAWPVQPNADLVSKGLTGPLGMGDTLFG